MSSSAEYQREYRKRNPEKVREWQKRAEAKRRRTPAEHWKNYGRAWTIRKKYEVTEQKYEALLSQVCAICGEASEVLDHDHATGQIRGPLCFRCNNGLGSFRDKPELLTAAILYLGPQQ